MTGILRALSRRKSLSAVEEKAPSQLSRVLNIWDLTALGVGSTLGVGIYVLAGNVSRNLAGPAVVLSFLIAAVASVLSGFCYSEFGARVPCAGSAYMYTYVTVGEFVAFCIGWNLILEYIIGSASVARGLTLYFDSVLNGTLSKTFQEIAPINVYFLSPYFDFLAFSSSIILTVVMALGVKKSSLLNNILTAVNLAVVIFVITVGATVADVKNWNISKEDIPQHIIGGGDGGFFPFGLTGVLKGAATCFYGFVGFDCIATTGEEVKNPKRAIPISIVTSLFITFFAYFGVSAVLTLMWPYYSEDENAPIPYAFEQTQMSWAKWTVAIGGICGLVASLFGAMFPLPRIIYAMATDGLIFQTLGLVNQKFHTPLIGTLLAGLFTGTMAALFELHNLVEMMSIGTLMAYTIVASCVLLLRYECEKNGDFSEYIPLRKSNEEETDYTDSPDEDYQDTKSNCVETARVVPFHDRATIGSVLKQLLNRQNLQQPSPLSSTIVAVEVIVFCCVCPLLAFSLTYLYQFWAIVTVGICIGLQGALLLSIGVQPITRKSLYFKVPLVPLIPALSIMLNFYLILMLSRGTWVRFAIWMGIGFVVYFGYSIRHSAECENAGKKKLPLWKSGLITRIPSTDTYPDSPSENEI